MSSPDDSVTAVWSSALAELEASPDMTPRQLAFIKLAHPLALVEGNMILAVANEWTRDYLESRVRLELTEALVNATERDDARFAITVDTTLDDGTEAAHLRQFVGPGCADHQQAVAIRVPALRNGVGNVLVQRAAIQQQILEFA